MKGLSKIVTRHYKVILGIWLLLFAALAVLAIRLPGLLEGDGFSTDGEHAEVMEELTKNLIFLLSPYSWFLTKHPMIPSKKRYRR